MVFVLASFFLVKTLQSVARAGELAAMKFAVLVERVTVCDLLRFGPHNQGGIYVCVGISRPSAAGGYVVNAARSDSLVSALPASLLRKSLHGHPLSETGS